MTFIRKLATSLVPLALQVVVKAANLEVLGEPYPPFLVDSGGKLTGPFVDAFNTLLVEQGIEAHYTSMPSRRISQVLPSHVNTCALAVHYSPGDAETVRYIAPVAPITLSVYTLAGESKKISSLQELKKYSVGAIDIAEVRELLSRNEINYTPIPANANAMRMLQAHRFDILISDSQPELDRTNTSALRVLTLAHLERWLACQQGLPSGVVGGLRRAMKHGVYAESVRNIWARYNLAEFYDDVRKDWASTRKTN